MTTVTPQSGKIAAAHRTYFGVDPMGITEAPGRVNLLGEHTDYNGGFVLPIALKDLGVDIAIGHGTAAGLVEVRSQTFDATAERHVDDKAQDHWSDYILGCAALVARDHVAQTGLQLTVSTSVPLGAGLSSSAALEVATIRALNDLFSLGMSDVDVAISARKVENEFVGVPCGIMDQFASSVGTKGQALFLNTRTLDFAPAPSFETHSFVVLDSGVRHQLSDGGYAQRVKECNAACAALGVEYLSDLGDDDLDRINALPAPLNQRARHILIDNRMAKQGHAALNAGQPEAFGQLMVQSHATARDNFEITVPETDALAQAAVELGALGARQTGGGWGGAIVALVQTDDVDRWIKDVTTQFEASKLLAVT